MPLLGTVFAMMVGLAMQERILPPLLLRSPVQVSVVLAEAFSGVWALSGLLNRDSKLRQNGVLRKRLRWANLIVGLMHVVNCVLIVGIIMMFAISLGVQPP